MAKKVINQNKIHKKINTVCGVDVSYKVNLGFCSAVLVDFETKQVIESVSNVMEIKSNYIPGFFVLREGPIILKTLKKITKKIDVLMVDGNGILHPRKCGMASYIGICTDLPTIGVTKNLLCGTIGSDSKIIFDNQILGQQIKTNKKIYVSIGHKIDLDTAVNIVKQMIIKGFYPEPLRLADQFSKMLRKESDLATGCVF